jgi:hypothetical protein
MPALIAVMDWKLSSNSVWESTCFLVGRVMMVKAKPKTARIRRVAATDSTSGKAKMKKA